MRGRHMADHAHSGHDSAQDPLHGSAVTDPVCGMKVDPATATYRHHFGATDYFFCSAHCLEKFKSDPNRYLRPRDSSPVEVAEGTIWTCPMHPEIRRNGPGQCPICGMALEPLEPTLDEGPNPELIDMSRRFWVSTAFTVPL